MREKLAALLICTVFMFMVSGVSAAPKEKTAKGKGEDTKEETKGAKGKKAKDDGTRSYNPGIRATEEPVLESDKPDAESKRVFLPVLEEGAGSGNFIYYDRPKFLFVVDKEGEPWLTIKDKDGQLLDNLKVKFSAEIGTSWQKPIKYNEFNRLVHRWVHRRPVEITDVKGGPTEKPEGRIVVRAKLMDGVEFHRVYGFNGDEVEVLSGFECKNKDYPSYYRESMAFPETMTFDATAGLEERKTALKGWMLKFSGARVGGKRDYGFWEGDELPKYAQSAEINGPFGDIGRYFYLEVPKRDTGIEPRIYKGNCPHQGFTLALSGPGNNSASSAKYRGFRLKVYDVVGKKK